jgi:shikimate dehydrogenase
MNKKVIRQFGLIGYPLSHSFSKRFFTKKFEKENIEGCHYELFPLDTIETFLELIKSHPNLVGLNVTIPYKKAILDYLDEIDEEAEKVGAVNTISIKNGKLKGYNTDVYGFEISLLNLLKEKKEELPNISALILGTGGAAQAVAYVLKKLSINFQYVSRRKRKNILSYSELDEFLIKKHDLIINTTPLGMSPNQESCPDIPYPFLTSRHFLYDLVYNPEKTLFLRKGASKNARTSNGLEMLILQAEKAWEIWNQNA